MRRVRSHDGLAVSGPTERGMTTIRCVSVSGGKDSTACALLALEQFGPGSVRLVFADTGNEHVQTLDYVLDYLPHALGVPVHVVRAQFGAQIARKAEFVRETWPQKGVSADKVERALAILKPTGNPFLDLCLWKGRFPSRKAQFCTQELKTMPLTEWHLEVIDDGYLVESWQGVRRDESRARRDAAEREDVGGGLSIYRPIVAWTAQQTVDYVRRKGLVLNPLYSQGMARVGCMPCINARKDEVLEIARRFPEHIERIAEWERLVQEASKRDGATFFAGANRGDDLPVEECVEKANIRAMVEWAKTSRGGVQYDMLRVMDTSPACASAYGLCE